MKKSLFFSLLSVSLLQAQFLTLQECLDKSMKSYPDVHSFELKVKERELSYKSAFSSYLPQISFNAQYNLTQTYILPVNGSFNTVDDTGWSAGVALKQKVWDFSKTSSNVDAQKIQKSISKLSLEEFKAVLAYRVKLLYASMIVNKKAIDVRREDLKAKEAYYEQAEALVKQGLKTKADRSRFLSAVYLAKENLSLAITNYNKVRNRLSLYINETISEDVVLQKDFIQKEFAPSKEVEKEILQKNYTLRIEDKNIEKNLLLHKSAKAAHYGSIDFIASYTYIDTLKSYKSKMAALTLNIPLYSGGRVSADAQKAKIAADIAKEQKASREIALKEEIENLFYDIQQYKQSIAAKKAQILAAQDTKSVLDARYKEGLATYIEVLDAASTLLGTQLGLLEVYYNRAEAIYRIDYLKGKYDE